MILGVIGRLWCATAGRSQFLRFAMVGTVGYVIDAGIVTALIKAGGLDPYSARVLSFLAAATSTWWLNRNFTFTATGGGPRARQWLRFVMVNAMGAAINYGAYAVALQLWPLTVAYPAIAVGVGSLAGLAFNFPASKYLVFRQAAAGTRGMTEPPGSP